MNRLHEPTTGRRMTPPDHLEPTGERVNQRLDDNAFILGELARAKERARHWKRLWTREIMKRVGKVRFDYTQFELDHADAESAFWHDSVDGHGVIVERQS